MNTDTTVTFALVAIVGSVITALFKLLSDNTKALVKLSDTNERGNAEAKTRNGHLGDQNIQITKLITGQSNDLAAIKTISQTNADTNARVEEIMLRSAHILTNNETIKTEATAAVRDALKS